MGKSKNRPQVFINFRGEDERQKLLPHLKHHLKDRNVNVFTDDDAFAEPVENLFKHIRRSRIVIVIFSINYLASRWCLDELVQIKKCLECEKLDFVIPIFYKVKTSDVKKLSGKFGKKFVALQEKHRSSRVKRWKKALRYVARSIGLTYEKRSSISELDFIKKIVERVGYTLTKIAPNDTNDCNNTPEASQMPHLSTTLEPQNLEKAINWLALHMVNEQANPALIFSNWDKYDDYTKKNIIYSARTKAQMLRVYNGGVDSRSFLSTNVAPSYGVPTGCMLLEPNVSQDSRRSISYHNNINQYHPPPLEALNLESSNLQGVMVGSARKDAVISSMHSSSPSFRISHPLQFRGYNWGVDSRPFIPTNSLHVVMHELALLNRDYRQSISHDKNINRYDPPLCEFICDFGSVTRFSEGACALDDDIGPKCYDLGSEEESSIPYQPSRHYLMLPSSDDAEGREDKTNYISLLCYYFKRFFSLTWGAKCRGWITSLHKVHEIEDPFHHNNERHRLGSATFEKTHRLGLRVLLLDSVVGVPARLESSFSRPDSPASRAKPIRANQPRA